MSKHTAGPWYSHKTAGGHHTEIYDNDSGAAIAITYHNFGDEDEANANLIASAPEILDTLKTVHDWILGGCPCDAIDIDMQVHAAIAKAEGKQ